MIKTLIKIGIFLYIFVCYSQTNLEIDNLIKSIKVCKTDTAKFKLKGKLIYALLPNNPDKAKLEMLNCLNEIEKLNNPKLKAQMYIVASTVYITINVIDSANYYSNLSLKIAKKFNFKEIQALNYNNLSKSYLRIGNFIESIKFQNASLATNIELKNESAISKDYTNLAGIYLAIPDYEQSLNYNFKAIPFLEKVKNYDLLWCIYIQQCVVYNRLFNFKKAIEMGEKSLKLGFINNFKNDIANSYKELGSVYMNICEKKQIINNMPLNQANKLCFNYYFKAKNIFKELNNEHEYAQMLNYIGTQHLFNNSLDSALYYFKEDFIINLKDNNSYGLCASNVSIGDVYLKMNKLNLAEKYLLDGLSLAKENSFIEYACDASENLYALNLKKGNSQKALNYYTNFITYRDSILNDEKRQNVLQSQMKYDLDKKRVVDSLLFVKDKVISKATLKEEKTQKWLFVLISIFSLVSVSFVFYQYKLKKKTNLELNSINQKINKQNNTLKTLNVELIQSEDNLLKANNSKEQLISLISHDLLNPITAITNYNQEILNSKTTNLDLREAFKNVDAAIIPMHNLLNNMLHWTAIQKDGLKPNLKLINGNEIVQEIVAIYLPQAKLKFINITTELEEKFTYNTDKSILSLIIRNVLNNAIKYSENNTQIYVKAAKNYIKIIDSGYGMTTEDIDFLNINEYDKIKVNGTGLGLKLCLEFAKNINANLVFSKNEFNGTTVLIQL